MTRRTVALDAAGVSLFHVAMRETGDARHWWRIAEANGLDDFAVEGLVTLAVPPAGADLSGLPPE